MNVLHLAAGNLYGGVETFLLTLARLRYLCPEMEPHFGLCFPGRLRDELTATGAPVHDLGPVRVSRPWTLLRGRRRLTSILKEPGIDAVVTHGCWPHAMFAPPIKRLAVRLANLVHDALRGRHWIDRWAARTPPDVLIANSRFTAGMARSVFPNVSAEVIPYPVAAIKCEPSLRPLTRASLGTPENAVVILQASRLERWKGHAVHLQALAQMKEIPNWIAWFAGGPQKANEVDYQAELLAAAKQGGIAERVRFLGQRSDVPQLMAAADIYCQPNVGPEPFGIVFVEALDNGLPVVSSNFGGVVEIVTNTCGVLCPPGDVEALARTLAELVTNPSRRKELSRAGPSRATEMCDPARQMAALARAIAQINGGVL
jgi:glycosyltransferase involved in cell wall biosynthesis